MGTINAGCKTNEEKPHIHKNSTELFLWNPWIPAIAQPPIPSLAVGDLNRNSRDSAKAFPEDCQLIHPLKGHQDPPKALGRALSGVTHCSLLQPCPETQTQPLQRHRGLCTWVPPLLPASTHLGCSFPLKLSLQASPGLGAILNNK